MLMNFMSKDMKVHERGETQEFCAHIKLST